MQLMLGNVRDAQSAILGRLAASEMNHADAATRCTLSTQRLHASSASSDRSEIDGGLLTIAALSLLGRQLSAARIMAHLWPHQGITLSAGSHATAALRQFVCVGLRSFAQFDFELRTGQNQPNLQVRSRERRRYPLISRLDVFDFCCCASKQKY